MNPTRERTIVRRALLGSFGLSFLLGVLAFFLGEGRDLPLCTAALFFVALGLYLVLCRAGRSIRWMLALAMVNALTLVPELSLRLAGFYQGPRIEFGYPDPDSFQAFVRDPELFWINPPGSPGFNSLGFRGRELVLPKPAGTTRVVFLGDSCTAIGQPQNYPMIVEDLLRESDPGGERGWEVVNLAVPGYSTNQGRVLAERFADRLGADLALVYFGWNDHWQAYGSIDSEKRVPPRAQGLAAVLEDVRLLHGLRWLRARFAPRPVPLDEVRVPPDDFRANLRAIVARFHAAGTPVVLVTAPSTFERYGAPQPLVDQGFLPDRATGVARHAAYMDMIREAARLEGAALLDLAARFDRIEEPRPLFWPDGIHFTAVGRRRVAEAIASNILETLGPP